MAASLKLSTTEQFWLQIWKELHWKEYFWGAFQILTKTSKLWKWPISKIEYRAILIADLKRAWLKKLLSDCEKSWNHKNNNILKTEGRRAILIRFEPRHNAVKHTRLQDETTSDSRTCCDVGVTIVLGTSDTCPWRHENDRARRFCCSRHVQTLFPDFL